MCVCVCVRTHVGTEKQLTKISEPSSITEEVKQDRISETVVPNYVVFLRELFVGMIGMHAVYIFVNFIFRNYPGSLLSLLL